VLRNLIADLGRRRDVVGFERTVAPGVTMNDPGAMRWDIRNPLRHDLTVAVADELAPSLHAERRRITTTVPARRSVQVVVPFHPSRRGRFHPDEVVVRTRGSLGLVARQATRSVPGAIRVHPEFRSWRDAEIRIRRARMLHIGVRAARIRGGGTDFDQLREYTTDDETRRIDWAATARSGRPIVRTYRAERNQNVINLLDSGRVMAGRVEDVPRFEHAVDAVMALTAVSAALGDRCGLAVFDRSLHTVVGAAGGRRQLGRVTDAMFDIEPALVESDYSGAFAAALATVKRRSLLVIHTDLVEQIVRDTLLPAMPLVVRSHVVVVAAVRDPAVQLWARRRVHDGDGARRRAAAAVAIDERARAAAALRAAGAVVVDAAPDVVAGQLADVYLDVKTSGRL